MLTFEMYRVRDNIFVKIGNIGLFSLCLLAIISQIKSHDLSEQLELDMKLQSRLQLLYL